MTFNRARAFFCTLCALALAVAPAAVGTTVLAPRFEAMVDRADLIFTGQVLAQRSEWRNRDGQKSIVTLVTLGVQQVHKGRAGDTITLQFLGGTVGDVTLDVAEIPRFKNGERVVLFVADNGVAVSPIIGFFHGKFSLRKNGLGREEMLQHNGEPLAEVSEVGRPKAKAQSAARPALSHEDFSRKIRERAAQGPGKP